MTGAEPLVLAKIGSTSITLSHALTAVGMIAGAAGALQGGAQQSAQMRFQADMADREGIIAEQNRVAALQQGAEDERRLRREQRFALSRARAGRGQMGIDPGFGSPLLMAQQDEVDAELNALTQMYQTQLRARGFAGQAATARATAGGFRMGASQARQQGFMGAGTALLQGAGRLF